MSSPSHSPRPKNSPDWVHQFLRGPEFVNGKMSGFAGRTPATVSCSEAAVHLGLRGPKSGMRDRFKAGGHHRQSGSTLA